MQTKSTTTTRSMSRVFADLAIFGEWTYSWCRLIPDTLCETPMILTLCEPHCKGWRIWLVNWWSRTLWSRRSTPVCRISWVVMHSPIRGFVRRRGGRLGNPGLYSRSQVERLCHWHGTRILWVALHVLRRSEELVEGYIKTLKSSCYYSIDGYAEARLPSAMKPLDEGLWHSDRAFTYAV